MSSPGPQLAWTEIEPEDSPTPLLSEKQQAILDAATTVFLREGYERASVDTIAAEAGVSKRTIYNHFCDKKQLFTIVVELARARANEITPDDPNLLSDPGLLDTELVTVGTRLLNVLLDTNFAALRRVIVAEVHHHPGLGPACREGTPQVIARGLADRFARLAERGALEIADASLAARQFIALIMYEGEKQSGYGTHPLSDDAKRVIAVNAATFFLRAYCPRKDA